MGAGGEGGGGGPICPKNQNVINYIAK